MRTILVIVAATLSVSCGPRPYSGEHKLEPGQLYRAVVDIPGQGPTFFDHKYIQLCEQARMEAMTSNLGATVIEDCHVVD